MSSADKLYKQFGPRPGPTNVGPGLDSSRLTLWLYSWNNTSKKLILNKGQQTTKKHEQLSCMHRVSLISIISSKNF